MNRILRVTFLLLALGWNDCALAASDQELSIAGKVEGGSVSLSHDAIAALPAISLKEQHASMTEPALFKGPPLTSVLALAKASGAKLVLTALDDYVVEASMEEIEKYQPILAYEMNGKPLSVSDFGPYFLVWPFAEHAEINTESYHAKAIWQLVRIDVE